MPAPNPDSCDNPTSYGDSDPFGSEELSRQASESRMAKIDLNPAQMAAVQHLEGPLVIVAGPGSGKTRVTTQRVAHMVACGIRPEEILAITFTNKAAGEMLERTLELLGQNSPGHDPYSRPQVSTFHSFCARLLRREIYRIEPYQTNFNIYDTTDQKGVISAVLQKLELEKSSFQSTGLLSQISRWKNELTGPADVEKDAFSYKEKQTAKIYRGYLEALALQNALDFDDLLILTLRVLTEHPDVLERRRRMHRYLLIDEFQDTNRPQYLIARLLAEEHRNICVTGDPDQSIYSWRGAHPGNFNDFLTDFPEHERVYLSQNYRSTPQILAAASRLTQSALGQRELFTENPEGDSVVIQEVTDEKSEAREIASWAEQSFKNGESLNEMAVLYRVNSTSRTLEEEFLRVGLPYGIVGGVAFYQRKEVRDIIGYLRLSYSDRDDASFRRIINVPGRGIGKVSFERFAETAFLEELTLGQALYDDQIIGALSPRPRKAFLAFRDIINDLRDAHEQPLVRQVELAIERSRYSDYLDRSEPQSAEERMENLQELVAAAGETEEMLEEHRQMHAEEKPQETPPSAEKSEPEITVDSEAKPVPMLVFLERIALIGEADKKDDEHRERITLMSLHAAKGLEYDRVAIAGFEDHLIPHVRHYDEGNLDEERRLLYVGITRARMQLRLYQASYRRTFRGQREARIASPFQEEILGEGVELKANRWEASAFDMGSLNSSPCPSARYNSGSPSFTQIDGESWEEEGLRPGTVIESDLLGRGVVVSLSGFGSHQRAAIEFDEVGQKQVLVQQAKLRIISTPTEF